MELEEQVTSVGLSNKLRDLFDAARVQKPSIFFRDWRGAKEDEIGIWKGFKQDWCEDNIPCYTVAELGEMLPREAWGCDNIRKKYRVWWKQAPVETDWVADTEADARAKMLIYLLENKLIESPPAQIS